MGKFHAEVGADTRVYEKIVREFGERPQNQERGNLLYLCNTN